MPRAPPVITIVSALPSRRAGRIAERGTASGVESVCPSWRTPIAIVEVRAGASRVPASAASSGSSTTRPIAVGYSRATDFARPLQIPCSARGAPFETPPTTATYVYRPYVCPDAHDPPTARSAAIVSPHPLPQPQPPPPPPPPRPAGPQLSRGTAPANRSPLVPRRRRR